MNIWVRNYINPRHSIHENPLYFTVINNIEIIIPQNSEWSISANHVLMSDLELVGEVQDRKLSKAEIVTLKLKGII